MDSLKGIGFKKLSEFRIRPRYSYSIDITYETLQKKKNPTFRGFLGVIKFIDGR